MTGFEAYLSKAHNMELPNADFAKETSFNLRGKLAEMTWTKNYNKHFGINTNEVPGLFCLIHSQPYILHGKPKIYNLSPDVLNMIYYQKVVSISWLLRIVRISIAPFSTR
jgi:hypothetical protein